MSTEHEKLKALIRADREQRGMTVTEHARHIGISRNVYYRWLRGEEMSPGAQAILRMLPDPIAGAAEIAA